MHRGTYGKIPVIMGDYDTELDDNKSNRQPRSWYSNNEGRLFFIDLNGDVIDVFSKIIKIHEESGHHERLDLTEGFKLKLPYASNYTIIQKTGGDGYDLDAPLLPLNYGGTGTSNWNDNKNTDNFVICNGSNLLRSDYSGGSFLKNDALANYITRNQFNDLINNKLNKYASLSSFTSYQNKIADFIAALPTKIYEMIFPTDDFNGIRGVRILKLSVSGGDQNSRDKKLKIKLNKNTGWGISPHGNDSDKYKMKYNKDTNGIDLYGSDSKQVGTGTAGNRWDDSGVSGENEDKITTKWTL